MNCEARRSRQLSRQRKERDQIGLVTHVRLQVVEPEGFFAITIYVLKADLGCQ